MLEKLKEYLVIKMASKQAPKPDNNAGFYPKTPYTIKTALFRYREAMKRMKSFGNVLDCGCSGGYGTELLAERSGRVTGLDLSDKAIQIATKANSKRTNVSFVQASALAIPADARSFDAVCCFEIIEHMDETSQGKMLSEISRVLKDDGVLFISTPNRDRLQKLATDHVRELNLWELGSLLDGAFNRVEIMGHGRVNESLLSKAMKVLRTTAVATGLIHIYRFLVPASARSSVSEKIYSDTAVEPLAAFQKGPLYFFAVCSEPKTSS
jgi:ubiquinone/menaquinone biosynthesis C-methylase UbiE